jgi:AraC-like DNA-binding protein
MANWGAEGMYSPVKDGVEKTVRAVCYTEAPPPDALASIVHCYWELKTEAALGEDFALHALPDACVNILFNQIDTNICGVTALRTRYEVLNLGQQFHYVGIQLLPGAWTGLRNNTGPREPLFDRYVGTPYQGQLPLVQASKDMTPLDFAAKHGVMSALVRWCVSQGLVVGNAVTASILGQLDRIHSVGDMAAIAGLSPRQLQRTLKRSTGFSPHDLLKVLRLQQSFKQHYLELYADQAHFIHSFRKITGYTPAKFAQKFDV